MNGARPQGVKDPIGSKSPSRWGLWERAPFGEGVGAGGVCSASVMTLPQLCICGLNLLGRRPQHREYRRPQLVTRIFDSEL